MPALQISVTVRPQFIGDLCQWWKVRADRPHRKNLAAFLSELIESELIAYRSTLRRAAICQPPKREEKIVASKGRKRQLSAEETQRLLHLHFHEQVNVPALAKRFGCGATTVTRILHAYRESQHVRVLAVHPAKVYEESRERRKNFSCSCAQRGQLERRARG
jgi:transposase-like protein